MDEISYEKAIDMIKRQRVALAELKAAYVLKSNKLTELVLKKDFLSNEDQYRSVVNEMRASTKEAQELSRKIKKVNDVAESGLIFINKIKNFSNQIKRK